MSATTPDSSHTPETPTTGTAPAQIPEGPAPETTPQPAAPATGIVSITTDHSKSLDGYLGPIWFLWKFLVGALLTQIMLGAVMVFGWTMRAMRRATLKQWWKCSQHRQPGTRFNHWIRDEDSEHETTHWPNWVFVQNFRTNIAHPQGNTFLRRLGYRLACLTGSLGQNMKLGIQGIFNVSVLTLPGTAIMLFSWYDGWNNSFTKGYEQAPVGPSLGLLGVGLFIIAMLYVPMALARQASSGNWKAFYEFSTVWGLVKRHRAACLALAVGYAMLWIPVSIAKTAPGFFAHNNPTIASFTPTEALNFLNGYHFWCGFMILAILIILRTWSARIYARAVLTDLQKGYLPVFALSETERRELARLDLIQVNPPRTRHPLVQVAATTGNGFLGAFLLGTTCLVWFAFVAQIYISEFLNYHPVTGFLNQSLIQLPWFRYIPSTVQNQVPEFFLGLLLLGLLFGGAALVRKIRKPSTS